MLVVVEATSGNGGDRLAPLIDEHGMTNVALNRFRLRSCRGGELATPSNHAARDRTAPGAACR
jgi:hypothetical protein